MREISYQELCLNPVEAFRDDWMLVTAGSAPSAYSTMTVGWGHMGSLWNRPCAVVYVRPERYTKRYIDQESYFTLSWFGQAYRKELLYLGTKSGRNEDKVGHVDFHAVFSDGSSWFEEARLVLVCRKIYAEEFHEEHFFDAKVLDTMYPDRQFHTAYFGEIVKIFQRERCICSKTEPD